MASDWTVEDYRAALSEYQQAEKQAQDMVGLIRKVNECLGSSAFNSFLGWSLGIYQLEPGQRLDPEANVDLDQWPDADEIRERFTAWHLALTKLRHVWSELPEASRRELSAPPPQMEPGL